MKKIILLVALAIASQAAQCNDEPIAHRTRSKSFTAPSYSSHRKTTHARRPLRVPVPNFVNFADPTDREVIPLQRSEPRFTCSDFFEMSFLPVGIAGVFLNPVANLTAVTLYSSYLLANASSSTAIAAGTLSIIPALLTPISVPLMIGLSHVDRITGPGPLLSIGGAVVCLTNLIVPMAIFYTLTTHPAASTEHMLLGLMLFNLACHSVPFGLAFSFYCCRR